MLSVIISDDEIGWQTISGLDDGGSIVLCILGKCILEINQYKGLPVMFFIYI